jgi:hypothetical protein
MVQGLMKRERTKMAVQMVAGAIKPFPAMVEKLVTVPEGVEWLDDYKARGENPRVPVIMRESGDKWSWLGLRSAFFLNGGERVSFKGATRRAERREMDFADGSRKWLWVIDDTPALSLGVFLAPFPLESKEHAREYNNKGINGLLTSAQAAARMGWKGGDGVAAAERFMDYLFACMGGNEKLMEIRRGRLGNIRLPSPVEMVEKRMSWQELAATIATMGETVARLERELEALRGEVATLRGLVI